MFPPDHTLDHNPHTHTYIHTQTYKYTHIRTHVYTHTHTYIHMYTHIQEFTYFNAHYLNLPSLLRHLSRSHCPEYEQSEWGGRARRQMEAPPSLPESQQHVHKTCDWFRGRLTGSGCNWIRVEGVMRSCADPHYCLRDGTKHLRRSIWRCHVASEVGGLSKTSMIREMNNSRAA